jgi:hypothetical protein
MISSKEGEIGALQRAGVMAAVADGDDGNGVDVYGPGHRHGNHISFSHLQLLRTCRSTDQRPACLLCNLHPTRKANVVRTHPQLAGWLVGAQLPLFRSTTF